MKSRQDTCIGIHPQFWQWRHKKKILDIIHKICDNPVDDADSIKIRDSWLAAMDAKEIENLGISPVKKLLDFFYSNDVTICLAFMVSQESNSPVRYNLNNGV